MLLTPRATPAPPLRVTPVPSSIITSQSTPLHATRTTRSQPAVVIDALSDSDSDDEAIVSVQSSIVTSRSIPLDTTHTNRSRPAVVIDIQSDSDDETIVSVLPPPEGRNPPTHVDGRVHDQSVLTPAPHLPRSLAEIQPEDSILPIDGSFSSYSWRRTNPLAPDVLMLKRRIAVDPFYLGEPQHITLRNPRGSAGRWKMATPYADTKTRKAKDKWIAVSCGTEVGVFPTWLVPSSIPPSPK